MKTKIVPENRLKCIEIALLIGLAVFLISGGLALRTQTRLADRVVRLHVLANSDGEEDQALKLLVRDRVLAQATELLTQAKDRTEAETLLRAELVVRGVPAFVYRRLRRRACRCAVGGSQRGTGGPHYGGGPGLCPEIQSCGVVGAGPGVFGGRGHLKRRDMQMMNRRRKSPAAVPVCFISGKVPLNGRM